MKKAVLIFEHGFLCQGKLLIKQKEHRKSMLSVMVTRARIELALQP